MKKILIAILLAGLAAYVAFRGIERYNYLNAQIPLPPVEFNAEEKQMMDSLGIKCANEGIIDLKDSTKFQDDDGVKCITAMCGEETAYSDCPKANELVKECYLKHGFIYPPIPKLPKEYAVFCVNEQQEYILQEDGNIAIFYSEEEATKKASEQYDDKNHDWKECGTYEL